jgi:N utilization substance protein B
MRVETRTRARALQVLYALEVTGFDLPDVDEGVARLTGQISLVLDRVEPMVRGIRAAQPEIDAVAQSAADNWRFERIAIVERNILRIAIFELRSGLVPTRVIIDEALWLAHRFAGARAPAFVNGVLDRAARDLGRL